MPTEWALIVLMLGLVPPQGMIQYGFDSELACRLEAAHYCAPDTARHFRCKCEPGLTPPRRGEGSRITPWFKPEEP